MCLLWVKFRRFWWSENTSAYPPTADFENEFSEFSEITSGFRRAADINSPVPKRYEKFQELTQLSPFGGRETRTKFFIKPLAFTLDGAS